MRQGQQERVLRLRPYIKLLQNIYSEFLVKKHYMQNVRRLAINLSSQSLTASPHQVNNLPWLFTCTAFPLLNSIGPFSLGKVQTFELPTALYQQTHSHCPWIQPGTSEHVSFYWNVQNKASKGTATLQRWSTKRDTTPAVRANPVLSAGMAAVVSELRLKLNLAFTVMQCYNEITMRLRWLTINRNKPSMSIVWLQTQQCPAQQA